MRVKLTVSVALALATAVLAAGAIAVGAIAKQPLKDDERAKQHDFEVWAIDQSDTIPRGGGTLRVFEGDSLGEGRKPKVVDDVDLGKDPEINKLCGTNPTPQRPHMLVFNGGSDSSTGNSHAALAFVATGHVVFLDAASREPIECIDVGAQAHAVWPTPDQKYLIVANQNGKLLQRIETDYADNDFTLDNAATLNLATCRTPSGAQCEDAALRPDNAPICPRTDEAGRFTFVTLRGGGMFVVDHNAKPMKIVAEYDKTTVHPNGCGGIETDGKMYINSGGGTTNNPSEHDVYAFPLDAFSTTPTPPNTPAPRNGDGKPGPIYSHDDDPARGDVDSHGVLLTKHGRYLWVADRTANTITVVNTRTDEVVEEFPLAGEVSDDPAPDLLDLSPKGDRAFVSLRGPVPQTGGHGAIGSTPGVGTIDVRQDGRSGRLESVARWSSSVGGTPPDPHAIRVRELSGR